MKISARVANQQGKHNVILNTDGIEKQLAVSPCGDGFGSSLNGGELLFLARRHLLLQRSLSRGAKARY